MVKLMIVEDEEIIREGILQMIDWQAHHIDICASATNGLEALELFPIHQPDLLLTDIRMPQLDGLDLIEQARSRGYNFIPVILSGYNDFNYARKGILLGVVDYVLKPCRPEELLSAVLTAKQQLEEQQSQDETLQQLQLTWAKNRTLAKQQKLTQWIDQRQVGYENRIITMKELEIKLQPTQLHVGTIQMDQQLMDAKYTPEDRDTLQYAIMNILAETLEELYQSKLEYFAYKGHMVWCANLNIEMNNDLLIKQLRKLQENIQHYLQVSISIGVGDEVEHINDIHISFQQAMKMLESRFFNGVGSIFIYNKVINTVMNEQDSILVNAEINMLEDELLSSIGNGQYATTLDLTEQWLDKLRVISNHDRNEVQLKISSFMLELQKLMSKQATCSFEWKNQIINWVEHLPHAETLDELSVLLKKMIQQLIEALSERQVLHRTVQSAIDLIHERYQGNLSLDQIAKEVFVSNTYLSTLFKQELGTNFLDYLHQFRIEKSKQLLHNQLKVFAVARMVGYQDERHFSHTFKKWTGVTPTQFQKQHITQ